MTDNRLNHPLMVRIYNDKLDETNLKLTKKLINAKKFRIATFGLYQL